MDFDERKLKKRSPNDKYSKNQDTIFYHSEKNSYEKSDSEDYYEDYEYQEDDKKGVLDKINTFVVLGFILYLFVMGIFPLVYRIIISIIFILILFFTSRKNKISSKLGQTLLSVFCVLFVIFAIRIDFSLAKMNRRNVLKNPIWKHADSFNIYLSGIDKGGSLDNISRSDVNIISTINTKNGNVLLTSVPRDTYLPIAGDGKNEYDKLTHAGNYGVESSVQTLANAFDIDIPYFARINFDSLISLVDVLGGITLYNDEEFQSRVTSYYFPKGYIEMNGDQALAFVRERYNLADGDMARGRNQEKVLSAMMKKAISFNSIINFSKIMEVLENSIDTNLRSPQAINIVFSQLLKLGKTNIESQEITGKGRMNLRSYAMPNNRLYMMVPDKKSMQNARDKMLELLK